jgi:c-di-GMP-related signal transduction protein
MDVYVARQPILDADQQIYAYELLFRSGLHNAFDGSDGNLATSQLIQNTFVNIGFDTLTQGFPAFINFTQKLIQEGTATLLPMEKVVIEVLETVQATDEVCLQLKKLKEKGFTIALDDVVSLEDNELLIEYADIIKVDFLLTDSAQRMELAENLLARGLILLAEKVESLADFEEAKALGYTLFQGYFFSQPVVVSGRAIGTNELQIFELLKEVHASPVNYTKLESVIKHDVALSYALMRVVNSVIMRRSTPVDSIGRALVILGESELRKWVSLVAMAKLSGDKSSFLLINSLTRGRFLELMAPSLKGSEQCADDLFLVGVFSLIDALSGRPIASVLGELPIKEEIKNTLLGKSTPYGSMLRLTLAYEKADWATVAMICEQHTIDQTIVPKLFVQAVDWVNESIKNVLDS